VRFQRSFAEFILSEVAGLRMTFLRQVLEFSGVDMMYRQAIPPFAPQNYEFLIQSTYYKIS